MKAIEDKKKINGARKILNEETEGEWMWRRKRNRVEKKLMKKKIQQRKTRSKRE